MIRFTQKPESAPTAETPAKKAAVKAADPVQLSLDPDAPEEEATGKPAKRRSGFKSSK
nr:hypothetical protein [uncultured Gellertiella sp.]